MEFYDVVYGYVITCKLLNCIDYGDKVKTRCTWQSQKSSSIFIEGQESRAILTVIMITYHSTVSIGMTLP